MRNSPPRSSAVRGLLAAAAAVSLGCIALAPLPASARTAGADVTRPTINTYRAWNDRHVIVPFGCSGTSNYGQVITVPDGSSSLQKVKFYVTERSRHGSMQVRAEVYRWDGTMATGPAVFESRPRSIALGSIGFHKQTFNAFGAPVEPGAQYVVFLTVDKDYDHCVNDYTLGWAAVRDRAYSGGNVVYLGTSGDESQWTSTPWGSLPYDLAFKAYLS